jgi:peptide deformylase
MTKLPLTYYDNPILKKRAIPIEKITPEIVQLAQDMIQTMIEADGVGLAAPQVGKSLRLFIIRDETMDAHGNYQLGPPEVLLNPVLSHPSPEKIPMVEGCLSLPGIHLEVFRPKSIHARYQNLKGDWIEEHLHNFRARVVMHENDHLNGVLTIDRIDKSERKTLTAQLQEIDQKYNHRPL